MAGSAPTNNSAVQFEEEQAAQAQQQEAQRQQRLTQGQQAIDQIFNGSPVMGPKSYDWSSFKAPQPMDPTMALWLSQNPGAAAPAPDTGDVPAGYTAVQVAPQAPAAGTPGAAAPGRYSGGSTGASAATPTGYSSRYSGGAATPSSGAASSSPVWALKDASGKIYNQGDPLTYQAPTGQTTGGFDDAFYDAYKQKVLDYYQPDEQRQYEAAQRDLTYSLARAGTLQSSTAADKQGELAYDDSLQKANIVANANTQEGNLKSQIQANKQSLINQLYSTEDPTLTANLAESSAAASRLQDPTLTPAASLFTPAMTSVGSAVQGLLYPSGQGTSSFANTGPVPASSTGTGSDKLMTV